MIGALWHGEVRRDLGFEAKSGFALLRGGIHVSTSMDTGSKEVSQAWIDPQPSPHHFYLPPVGCFRPTEDPGSRPIVPRTSGNYHPLMVSPGRISLSGEEGSMSVISDHRAPGMPVCGLSSPTEAQRARTEGLERRGKMKQKS